MSTTNRRTIASTVDLSLRVLKRRYEDIVSYGKDATNDLRVAYNIYNQIVNMYNLLRQVPAYTVDPGASALLCAVNDDAQQSLQQVENILFRFYGIQYYSALGQTGWHHTVSDSLIPLDQQPELIRDFPCSICFKHNTDNKEDNA